MRIPEDTPQRNVRTVLQQLIEQQQLQLEITDKLVATLEALTSADSAAPQLVQMIITNYIRDHPVIEALSDELHDDHARRWYECEQLGMRLLSITNNNWVGDTSMDLDDVWQIIAQQIYLALPTFKYRSKYTTWLSRIISQSHKQLVRDSTRQKRDWRRRESLDSAEHSTLVSAAPAPDQQLEYSELLQLVETKLREQPVPHLRAVFLLSHLRGWRGVEIAAKLGISQPYVSILLSKALDVLRQDPVLRSWISDDPPADAADDHNDPDAAEDDL